MLFMIGERNAKPWYAYEKKTIETEKNITKERSIDVKKSLEHKSNLIDPKETGRAIYAEWDHDR